AENATSGVSGISYQWESSPADEEDWSLIEDADSPTLTLSDGIDTSTKFRFTVECDNGNTDTSDPFEVAINAPEDCYCVPEVTSTVEPITHVEFAGIDNTTDLDNDDPDGYEDFTDITGEVEPGETYTITLNGYTNGDWKNYFSVYID